MIVEHLEDRIVKLREEEDFCLNLIRSYEESVAKNRQRMEHINIEIAEIMSILAMLQATDQTEQ